MNVTHPQWLDYERDREIAKVASTASQRVTLHEIPAQGGGGREGDYRQSSGALRYCVPEWEAGAAVFPRQQYGQPARRADATSAESAEGRLLGSHVVEGHNAPIRAPQAEINEAQMRADRIEEARRSPASAFLPWVIAAIIGLVVINAALAAPGKLRADLRMIEAMEETK